MRDLMKLDGDADGKISWAEFKTLITGEDPAKAAADAAAAEEKKLEVPVDNTPSPDQRQSFQGSQPDLSIGNQQIGRNFSQEQLSLGAQD